MAQYPVQTHILYRIPHYRVPTAQATSPTPGEVFYAAALREAFREADVGNRAGGGEERGDLGVGEAGDAAARSFLMTFRSLRLDSFIWQILNRLSSPLLHLLIDRPII